MRYKNWFNIIQNDNGGLAPYQKEETLPNYLQFINKRVTATNYFYTDPMRNQSRDENQDL